MELGDVRTLLDPFNGYAELKRKIYVNTKKDNDRTMKRYACGGK